MYEYKCFIVRVIDGNTIDAEVDLGFNVLIRQRIKLHGIKTADIRSLDQKEKDLAIKAKNRLIELLGKEFVCKTVMNKRGKTGRVLGYAFVEDEYGNRTDINQLMIDEGLATEFGN